MIGELSEGRELSDARIDQPYWSPAAFIKGIVFPAPVSASSEQSKRSSIASAKSTCHFISDVAVKTRLHQHQNKETWEGQTRRGGKGWGRVKSQRDSIAWVAIGPLKVGGAESGQIRPRGSVGLSRESGQPGTRRPTSDPQSGQDRYIVWPKRWLGQNSLLCIPREVGRPAGMTGCPNCQPNIGQLSYAVVWTYQQQAFRHIHQDAALIGVSMFAHLTSGVILVRAADMLKKTAALFIELSKEKAALNPDKFCAFGPHEISIRTKFFDPRGQRIRTKFLKTDFQNPTSPPTFRGPVAIRVAPDVIGHVPQSNPIKISASDLSVRSCGPILPASAASEVPYNSGNETKNPSLPISHGAPLPLPLHSSPIPLPVGRPAETAAVLDASTFADVPKIITEASYNLTLDLDPLSALTNPPDNEDEQDEHDEDLLVDSPTLTRLDPEDVDLDLDDNRMLDPKPDSGSEYGSANEANIQRSGSESD
ncbi:hypothetical protein GGX14DRAFT_402976 [Mycena pura]|uniref:Uncharacterized protein n=1 Tax=Mycena pura TaxID=153505 RepID=A0AAD6V0X9_9AGAR|nr:hypothetical protein GGX14DRAFT_402976 [Mycena pura]